jgi:signal transduction histidine kinase/CheY-like chemotaxis protein
MKTEDSRNVWKGIFIIAAVCCVLVAFALFINGNNKRATDISINSLKDATDLSASRIEDLLNRSLREIQLTSSLYEQMLENDDVESTDIELLTEKSPFDYIEFVGLDGITVCDSHDGMDVSGYSYYQDGINGNSGIDTVFGRQDSDKRMVVFYTPQYYKGDIIGVLVGLCRESQIQNIIYTSFFGNNARTYLCTDDGTIIAGCNEDNVSDSIFDAGAFHTVLDNDVAEELREALRTGTQYEFQYEGTGGTGNAYVTSIGDMGWYLVQTYPSQITAGIIRQSNKAGLILLAELVLIAVICLIFVQVSNNKHKKRLIRENTEKSYVINGIAEIYKTFVLVDLKEGTYRYLDGTGPRYKELEPAGAYSDFIDYVMDIMSDDEDKDQLREQFSKANLQENLSDDDTHYMRVEYRIKGEKDKWDSLNLICLKREDGIPTEVLFTYQDVTNIKLKEQRSYEALKEAYQAVESANHAKSDFLSNMSHDIRTPMNAVMGMTAIAAMNIDNPERVKDCLNKITVSSQHLLGLINEVLDMSKIESGKLVFAEEEFNLSDVVEHIVTMFLPQTQAKNQNFVVNASNITHEEVIGDSMRVQQIFANILSNAVKFTGEGGNISLKICEKPSGMLGCGCYEFTFEDTGIGMDEEFMDKIFEPFARAGNSVANKIEGTGLGMPIVKNIVQMMNGDIQVESKVNEGSRFVVTIYLKFNNYTTEDMEGLKDMMVLVADDDQFSCESACDVLKEIGMVADWVLSGQEAVDKLLEAQEQKEEYQAVILDWKMPGMDGVETARKIREEVGEDVPIIILSAYDYSSIEQEARAAGVNAFISKPMFKSRLVYVMKSLMLGEAKESTELDRLQNKNYENKRVLLVEDNELNTEIAVELLAQAGVKVECAENGKEAVDKIMEQPEGYYDMIFMDIQMPVMNGYDAARTIRASERQDLQEIPIVAMSADAFTDDVRKAKEAGMNSHVAKPVEIDKLLKALDEWL